LGSLKRRSVVDNRSYFHEGGQVGIETKRGCDRKCIYCADPLAKGGKLRLRPKSHVVHEMENLLAQGIDCFHLCDAEFNIPEEHAWELCREITKTGLGRHIRWYTYASPKPFSVELAQLMREAGCVGINFGVDSAHPGILRTLGRDFGPAEIVAAVQACNQAGIACMLDLLVGGPGETPETAAQTIRLVKGFAVTAVGVAVGIRIYPGTILAKMVEREGFNLQNANLRGKVEGNEEYLEPVFYLSSGLGHDPEAYVAELVGPDRRFFFMSSEETARNYNYNQNQILIEAIRQGYRGAYWHILQTIGGG
ncbi:MAG: radical SAM protein, partial [Bacillota bacterium]